MIEQLGCWGRSSLAYIFSWRATFLQATVVNVIGFGRRGRVTTVTRKKSSRRLLNTKRLHGAGEKRDFHLDNTVPGHKVRILASIICSAAVSVAKSGSLAHVTAWHRRLQFFVPRQCASVTSGQSLTGDSKPGPQLPISPLPPPLPLPFLLTPSAICLEWSLQV